MAEAGAGIAFCPTSNLFLGSGLFDLAQADRPSVKLGIGTDVGAGTSLSILHTLGEAYKVCQMRGAISDPNRAQLADAGKLVAAHPDVLMHTHLSENPGEIAFVAERYPDAADYLDVYDRFGLVGPRSVFAHCVHMSDRALGRMAEAGAGIAFCPTSNLFLGSGLFDLAQADRHSVKLGIGTDVGAGTSLSILRTLGEAYKVCQMRGASLDPFRALHLATAGGARIMGIADRVGGLLPGQEADFILLDESCTPLLARRCAGASLHDRLFALQVLGDDRAIAGTWLRGRKWGAA
jgi:guanine deaminase